MVDLALNQPYARAMFRRCFLNLLVAVLGGTAFGCAGPPPVRHDGDALGEWMSRHGGREPGAAASSSSQSPHALGRDAAAELVIAAMGFVDRPYRTGGDNLDSGFDCSGFTRHVFDRTLGIELPRTAEDQAHDRALSPVSRDALRPGDLVFFNTLRRTFSHVGIYVGDGRFIHAPRSGAQIRVESMSASYWSRRFTGARRALALADAGRL
jgi:cell wall-associated NlpC family hydrolase